MISAACMHEEEPRKYNTSIVPVNEAWLLTPQNKAYMTVVAEAELKH